MLSSGIFPKDCLTPADLESMKEEGAGLALWDCMSFPVLPIAGCVGPGEVASPLWA